MKKLIDLIIKPIAIFIIIAITSDTLCFAQICGDSLCTYSDKNHKLISELGIYRYKDSDNEFTCVYETYKTHLIIDKEIELPNGYTCDKIFLDAKLSKVTMTDSAIVSFDGLILEDVHMEGFGKLCYGIGHFENVTGKFDRINGCVDLPVELVSFGLREVDHNAKLKWVTATEVNNDKFVIWRSKNKRSWEFVAEVKGSGNSNVKNTYQFTDYDFKEPCYYKLVQHDFDGVMEELGIKFLNTTKEDNITVFPTEVNFGETIFISSSSPIYRIMVVRVDGSIKEYNKYNDGRLTNEISLSSGLYVVKVNKKSTKVLVR